MGGHDPDRRGLARRADKAEEEGGGYDETTASRIGREEER
jgi:hypothetical protein